MRPLLLALLLSGCAQAPYDHQASRQACLERVAAQRQPQQVRGRETVACQRINARGDVECRDTTRNVVVPDLSGWAALAC